MSVVKKGFFSLPFIIIQYHLIFMIIYSLKKRRYFWEPLVITCGIFISFDWNHAISSGNDQGQDSLE